MKDITKQFPGVLALDHVSLELYKGEILALLGENGAGKTTTISILCTTHRKTGGNVTVYGHELGQEDDRIRDGTKR